MNMKEIRTDLYALPFCLITCIYLQRKQLRSQQWSILSMLSLKKHLQKLQHLNLVRCIILTERIMCSYLKHRWNVIATIYVRTFEFFVFHKWGNNNYIETFSNPKGFMNLVQNKNKKIIKGLPNPTYLQEIFTFALSQAQDYTHMDHKHAQFHISSSNTSPTCLQVLGKSCTIRGQEFKWAV